MNYFDKYIQPFLSEHGEGYLLRGIPKQIYQAASKRWDGGKVNMSMCVVDLLKNDEAACLATLKKMKRLWKQDLMQDDIEEVPEDW